MKREEKYSSTGKRIKNQQQRRLKGAMFFSWLTVAILLCLSFFYITGSQYLGDGSIRSVFKEVSGDLAIKSSRGYLPGIEYTMSALGRAPETIKITTFFYGSIAGLFCLAVMNGIIGSISGAFAKSQIQNQLKPIYDLAENAVRLTDESDPRKSHGIADYDERMHDLESAIENIKPDVPNSKLQTADKDLKGLEDAINSLLERTKNSYSQQIRIVSDASHELRTPIAVIKGYTDMLDRWGKKDEKVLDESITAIKTETEHMNRLVQQLLFLARGDSGRTQLKLERFSLADMVREVYNESEMIDTDHEWQLYATDELMAMGDVALLKQAIRILVENATKYTPKGETITLKAVWDEKSAPMVVVQDSGMGIGQEDLGKIFDRFYRADPARGGQQGGSGLGLSIAKWIIDRHGGYFDVVSSENVGTRFKIHLPKIAE